ncbi:TonB-dependent receptor, partial [Sulfurimonas sp. SAG-AH-194-L11]
LQKFEDEEIVASEKKSYNAISAFVTNYNKFELFSGVKTILTESLRFDSYDNFDDALTGKLGLKQFVSKDYYVSMNVGTGYNVPSSYQLYNATYGDVNLKPEKSFTSDITVGNDTIWLTGFYNEITDLIDFVGVWPNSGYEQISGRTKLKGVEVGYEDYFFDSLGVNAMYTYLETEDANGKELDRRPKNQLDARVTYYVDDNWDLGVSAQYIGERFDGDYTGLTRGAETGKYTVANFVSNLKVNKSVTVYGKIDNITDVYYQTVDGYATAGRSLYFGLNAKY